MGGVAPRPARINFRRADQLDPFVQGDTGVNEFSRAAEVDPRGGVLRGQAPEP